MWIDCVVAVAYEALNPYTSFIVSIVFFKVQFSSMMSLLMFSRLDSHSFLLRREPLRASSSGSTTGGENLGKAGGGMDTLVPMCAAPWSGLLMRRLLGTVSWIELNASHERISGELSDVAGPGYWDSNKSALVGVFSGKLWPNTM